MPLKSRNLIDEDDPRVSQIGHPAPPWLVNYADLMTELVCFFVILYALSAALNKNVQNAAQQVKEMIDKGQMQGEVKMDREGLKISLQEHGQMAFFQSGKAELTPEMTHLMDKISPILYKLAEKHEIIVEGHTDNVPIATAQFASNWELSTARATSVVRYFLKEKKFPPERMAAIGYGEFRPVAANVSHENRQKNRRVVFFVKSSPAVTASKEPEAEKAENKTVAEGESVQPAVEQPVSGQPAAEEPAPPGGTVLTEEGQSTEAVQEIP